MRKPALVLLAAVSSSGCSASSLGDDLDAFCKVVTEVDQDAALSGEQKLDKIAARSKEFMRPLATPSDNIWEALAKADSDKKYGILLAAAERAGKRGWKCTSYQRLVHTVEAQRVLKEMKADQEKGASAGGAAAAAAAGAAAAAASKTSLTTAKTGATPKVAATKEPTKSTAKKTATKRKTKRRR